MTDDHLKPEVQTRLFLASLDAEVSKREVTFQSSPMASVFELYLAGVQWFLLARGASSLSFIKVSESFRHN
jgi:hypothetical protein